MPAPPTGVKSSKNTVRSCPTCRRRPTAASVRRDAVRCAAGRRSASGCSARTVNASAIVRRDVRRRVARRAPRTAAPPDRSAGRSAAAPGSAVHRSRHSRRRSTAASDVGSCSTRQPLSTARRRAAAAGWPGGRRRSVAAAGDSARAHVDRIAHQPRRCPASRGSRPSRRRPRRRLDRELGLVVIAGEQRRPVARRRREPRRRVAAHAQRHGPAAAELVAFARGAATRSSR